MKAISKRVRVPLKSRTHGAEVNVIGRQGHDQQTQTPQDSRAYTPTTFQLDLGVYYPIKVTETRQLSLQVNWFNVTNAQRAVRLHTNSGIPGANFIQFPNPFYGQGTVFQYPSSLRLGIKFQF